MGKYFLTSVLLLVLSGHTLAATFWDMSPENGGMIDFEDALVEDLNLGSRPPAEKPSNFRYDSFDSRVDLKDILPPEEYELQLNQKMKELPADFSRYIMLLYRALYSSYKTSYIGYLAPEEVDFSIMSYIKIYYERKFNFFYEFFSSPDLQTFFEQFTLLLHKHNLQDSEAKSTRIYLENVEKYLRVINKDILYLNKKLNKNLTTLSTESLHLVAALSQELHQELRLKIQMHKERKPVSRQASEPAKSFKGESEADMQSGAEKKHRFNLRRKLSSSASREKKMELLSRKPSDSANSSQSAVTSQNRAKGTQKRRSSSDSIVLAEKEVIAAKQTISGSEERIAEAFSTRSLDDLSDEDYASSHPSSPTEFSNPIAKSKLQRFMNQVSLSEFFVKRIIERTLKNLAELDVDRTEEILRKRAQRKEIPEDRISQAFLGLASIKYLAEENVEAYYQLKKIMAYQYVDLYEGDAISKNKILVVIRRILFFQKIYLGEAISKKHSDDHLDTDMPMSAHKLVNLPQDQMDFIQLVLSEKINELKVLFLEGSPSLLLSEHSINRPLFEPQDLAKTVDYLELQIQGIGANSDGRSNGFVERYFEDLLEKFDAKLVF